MSTRRRSSPLSYTEDDSGGAVTVLAPELIAGVTARVEPGSTILQYDGVVLDTGSLDSLGLSPMSSLPVLVQAMKSGHLDSYGEEDGLYVCRLEPNDEYRVAVWFEPDGMVPQRAELESGGRVTVIAEISGWTEARLPQKPKRNNIERQREINGRSAEEKLG